jgi:hypothetical protein
MRRQQTRVAKHQVDDIGRARAGFCSSRTTRSGARWGRSPLRAAGLLVDALDIPLFVRVAHRERWSGAGCRAA